ncbi:MAG TPA: hypothetical protein VJ861_11360 [Treponemataceae bacterium]|nr:hypothetical protein [Treponemataceae bacterium]
MEIKTVKTADLKFDKEVLTTSQSVSVDVPVIVDRDMNVIFGDSCAMKGAELKVLIIDAPFEEVRLAMHAIGRWATPNWKKLKSTDAPKYGYTAFVDDFLFNEVPRNLGVARHADKESVDFGELF